MDSIQPVKTQPGLVPGFVITSELSAETIAAQLGIRLQKTATEFLGHPHQLLDDSANTVHFLALCRESEPKDVVGVIAWQLFVQPPNANGAKVFCPIVHSAFLVPEFDTPPLREALTRHLATTVHNSIDEYSSAQDQGGATAQVVVCSNDHASTLAASLTRQTAAFFAPQPSGLRESCSSLETN